MHLIQGIYLNGKGTGIISSVDNSEIQLTGSCNGIIRIDLPAKSPIGCDQGDLPDVNKVPRTPEVRHQLFGIFLDDIFLLLAGAIKDREGEKEKKYKA
jgi:hypothetical protein